MKGDPRPSQHIILSQIPRRITGIILALFVLGACCFVSAEDTYTYPPFQQPQQGKWAVRVCVFCGDDESLKNKLESFVKRELREITDVEITTPPERAHFQISVTGLELEKSGRIFHHVYFYRIEYKNRLLYFWSGIEDFFEHFRKDMTLEELQQKTLEIWKGEKSRALLSQPQEIIEETFPAYIGTIPSSDLKETVEELVANFDTNFLEPQREMWHRFQGLLEDEPAD